MSIYDTSEGVRLMMTQQKKGNWNRWGPFLAERAWGTVREDYSHDGNAWSYFTHDHARSRAYRWNEDGLAGICDRHQYLCFALALWNGRDPFLKERLFGLTGPEGNHGEDVKEYYFYLDNTPSHSYMKYLYKYPQAEFPYAALVEENRRRTKLENEYELVDTGIFDEGRYFDVVVEYGKLEPEDLLICVTISNRGPEAAPIDVLPTLWFRNTWTWGEDDRRPSIARGTHTTPQNRAVSYMVARHWNLGDYILYCDRAGELLFTENETNTERMFNFPSPCLYVKDALHSYVVNGKREAVNPAEIGTKAAARFVRDIESGQTITIRLRLSATSEDHRLENPFVNFDALLADCKKHADEFYDAVIPESLSTDMRAVVRQAFAGMLWSKQYYHYVVTDWLEGDPNHPPPPSARLDRRNHGWAHMFGRDVISMPDKWEFPWFASWDLGFHCVALALIDPEFAKGQIILMLREWYTHPNGQIPAYEWDFNDVNPPVLALAARAVFEIERQQTGVADYAFIEQVFQKMLLNFTWWVNRKDGMGKNIFQGGFLGMDNIGLFDRNNLPAGYMLGQADGTSWMAAFAKSMLSTALLLAEKNPTYEGLASKFWEHYIYIANAMNHQSDRSRSLWDEEDGFFYDHLFCCGEDAVPIRARTMVGFVPMFGATTVPADAFDQFPDFQRRRQWFIEHRPELVDSIGPMVVPGPNNNLVLGLVRPDQLRRMLGYMLDENEFLSSYGVRSLSRYHEDHPLILHLAGQEYRLDYEPGDSQTNLFGGNSNWRGPVWIPMNFLIILALKEYHKYYGDTFKVELPTGSGNMITLDKVAEELERRLANIFLLDEDGERAVFGSCELFNRDPYWRDLIPFYEYFHGDTGRGCGASHQTGWSGLIAYIAIMGNGKPARSSSGRRATERGLGEAAEK